MPLFPTTATSPSPAPENMVAGVPMQPTDHPTSKLHLRRTLTAPVLVWLLALALASLLLLPALRPSPPAAFPSLNLAANSSSARCDVFRGEWVRDFTYPLYNSSACPFAERGFNCQSNGRRDRAYQTWRWRPRGCDLPRFDPRAALESLRGKRVVFVGDSMSRTQWESLICLLMPAAGDPASVYEVNGNRITKQIRFLGARFKPFNFTIEFFRSVFLVQQGSPPKHSPKRVRSVLRLDELDDMSRRWFDADVLVFNSGQWWNHGKLFGT